jgi:hypothetical protein
MNQNYFPVFIFLTTLASGVMGQPLTWEKVYSLHDKAAMLKLMVTR